MSFHKTAWHAAAAEYGKNRAERYGRFARARAAAGLLLAGLLVVGIVAAAHGAFGG